MVLAKSDIAKFVSSVVSKLRSDSVKVLVTAEWSSKGSADKKKWSGFCEFDAEGDHADSLVVYWREAEENSESADTGYVFPHDGVDYHSLADSSEPIMPGKRRKEKDSIATKGDKIDHPRTHPLAWKEFIESGESFSMNALKMELREAFEIRDDSPLPVKEAFKLLLQWTEVAREFEAWDDDGASCLELGLSLSRHLQDTVARVDLKFSPSEMQELKAKLHEVDNPNDKYGKARAEILAKRKGQGDSKDSHSHPDGRKRMFCHYCKKTGHTISRCFAKAKDQETKQDFRAGGTAAAPKSGK